MSVHEHSFNTSRADGTPRKPRVTILQILHRAVRRWQKNRAIAELRRLNDRQLQDIGLARNDIPRAVEGLFADTKAAKSAARPEILNSAGQHSVEPLAKAA